MSQRYLVIKIFVIAYELIVKIKIELMITDLLESVFVNDISDVLALDAVDDPTIFSREITVGEYRMVRI